MTINAASASTLTRTDTPVVLTGAGVGSLQGIAPGDLVAFRFDGDWEQIPVQVDERHVMNLRNVYPSPFSCNSGTQCFSPGNRVLNIPVYSDPVTFSGADPDATLDANDEVVFMAGDAGAQANGEEPAGVAPGSAVEIEVRDPIDDTVGYVYLFKREGVTLEPGAGRDYVSYTWDVVAISDEAADYKTEYKFGGGWNPERSFVVTDHYTRGFTDRWHDHELRVTRGGATGVDILDRHDASLTGDEQFTCTRQNDSFAQGEGAFVANIDGPVRAIRDYVGANSGPLVQRQHKFYRSSEELNTFLRVHAIPGPMDFFDYSSDAIGMTYKHWVDALPGVTIDGVPDVVPTPPAFLPRDRAWETVDGPQGGITMVHYYDTNNPDPTARFVYRDLAANPTNRDYCNGEGADRKTLLGASGPYASPVMMDTDSSSNFYLTYQRVIFFEAPGTTNGPARTAQENTPFITTAS